MRRRPPLLDHRLVEFAATIPARLRLRDGTTKYLLKQAMRGILPDDIIDRPKQGFAVPLARWFRGPLAGFARDVLLSDTCRHRGFLNTDYVERLLQLHQRGRDLDLQLWTTLSFELWCRRFLDRRRRRVEPCLSTRSRVGVIHGQPLPTPRRDRRGQPRHPWRPGCAGRTPGRGARRGTAIRSRSFRSIPGFHGAFGGSAAFRYLRTIVNQALYLPSLVTAGRRRCRARLLRLVRVVPAAARFRRWRSRECCGSASCSTITAAKPDDHLAHWGVLVHPWLRLADVIVVPSEYLAGVFAGHGYQTRVIRNVVDLSRFEYRERQPLRPRLLSTRNLEPHYRVDVILEAFALVKAQRPDATLTVAGYGSEESRLRRMAVEGVRFIGKVDPQSMPQVCAEADIFLNASVVDNQPVSILEAFAAGLPVVSTPTGDIPAMVRHNHTGLLVGPDDAASLAAAVLQLIAHPREAFGMAQQARQDVTRYTWPAVRETSGPPCTPDCRGDMRIDHTVLPPESEPWTSRSTL